MIDLVNYIQLQTRTVNTRYMMKNKYFAAQMSVLELVGQTAPQALIVLSSGGIATPVGAVSLVAQTARMADSLITYYLRYSVTPKNVKASTLFEVNMPLLVCVNIVSPGIILAIMLSGL